MWGAVQLPYPSYSLPLPTAPPLSDCKNGAKQKEDMNGKSWNSVERTKRSAEFRTGQDTGLALSEPHTGPSTHSK